MDVACNLAKHRDEMGGAEKEVLTLYLRMLKMPYSFLLSGRIHKKLNTAIPRGDIILLEYLDN